MINLPQGNDIDLEKISTLQSQGYSDSQIYDSLRKEGYDSIQIDDAINQAKLGRAPESDVDDVPEPGLKPSLLNEPSSTSNFQQESKLNSYNDFSNFQGSSFQSSRSGLDEVEALIETIIEEKWRSALQRFGNFDVWKERVKTDVASIKQELIRVEQRFDNIEKAVLGKISQYDRNIVNIGNEMKVLEQVFQKIVTPLTDNIKELSKITKELKK